MALPKVNRQSIKWKKFYNNIRFDKSKIPGDSTIKGQTVQSKVGKEFECCFSKEDTQIANKQHSTLLGMREMLNNTTRYSPTHQGSSDTKAETSVDKCGKDQNTHLLCQRAEHHWKTVEHFLKFTHNVLCRLLRENRYQHSW